MDKAAYSDTYIRALLDRTRTIAMVGASASWNRPSFFAMKYLQRKGFRVIPINPGQAGGTILGEMVHADLADVPGPFEMVDIFRNSAAAGPIADEAIRLMRKKGIEILWMQLGVENADAAARAEAAGLEVVMDRCPKLEFARLHGELGWGGINSGVITSKRRRI